MASCNTTQRRAGEKAMFEKLIKWAEDGLLPMKPVGNKQNFLADPVQCGRYRLDFVFEHETGVVIDEYDENGHANYNLRCELIRQGRVSLGYGGKPVHWIRYNPDNFLSDGQGPDSQTRDAAHLRHLQHAIQNPDYDHL